MNKKWIIGYVLFAICSFANAIPIEKALKSIEQNNTKLTLLRQKAAADALQSKTGLTPDNPSISFGHYWGETLPSEGRNSFAISQEVNFPTYYYHAAKLANQIYNNTQMRYNAERLDVLLRAKTLINDIIYYNALIKLYDASSINNPQEESRMDIALHLANAYSQKFQVGDASILDYNKAKLNLSRTQNKVAEIQAILDSKYTQLKAFNGGKDLQIENTSFQLDLLPKDFINWYTTQEEKNPALTYLASQIDIQKENTKVLRAKAFPKINMRYAYEKVNGIHTQGVEIGMSLPLWENRNKVKQAKAEHIAAQEEYKDAQIAFFHQLQGLYIIAQSHQARVLSYAADITQYTRADLLQEALDAGEINLITFLQELDYFYEAQEELLTMQHTLSNTLTELYITEL